MTTSVVQIDAYRTLGHASISGAFAKVGTPFGHAVRLICITNNTDGDMIFSVDGSTNNLFLPKQSFKLFDLNTNRDNDAKLFVLQVGVQFYVKQSTAPTAGDVYVECIYGLSE